jgi:hypothetical protein
MKDGEKRGEDQAYVPRIDIPSLLRLHAADVLAATDTCGSSTS